MGHVAADTSVFHAIADPTRRRVLDLLAVGPASVSELLEALGTIGQSALSQHLAVLRRAGLVEALPRGRLRVYTLRPEPLAEVADWVTRFDRFWDEKLEGLGAYLDRTADPAAKKKTKKEPR